MYRACEICEYFARHDEAEAGDCRRRAPVPVLGPAQEDHDARWPVVLAGEWCGEFVLSQAIEGGAG